MNLVLEQVIPLPPWNDEFWEGLPVFTYTKDGDNPRYTIAPSDLLIDEDLIEPAVLLSGGQSIKSKRIYLLKI